jgi:hypothetical protein
MLEPPVADPFPDDIDSLLSQTPSTAVAPEYRHLCIMSVLLGRITMFTRVGDRFPVSQEALERALGGLRRALLSRISEFTTNRISRSVDQVQPKPALNPETSKKE